MINVKTYVGLLDKIRVIKTQPLLVRFTLETIHQPLNCIVANVEIADKLMMMEERKYNIDAANVRACGKSGLGK